MIGTVSARRGLGSDLLKLWNLCDLRDYDGLPLYRKNSSTRIFPSNPITNSFNTKLSFGVLISASIWDEIKKRLKDP